MSETVAACPHCGSTSFRADGTGERQGARGRFRCPDCERSFNEFVRRPPRQSGTNRRGLAGDLADADPSEVSAE